MTNRAELFEAIRPFARDQRFTAEHVAAIDALADGFGLPRREGAASVAVTDLTPKIVLELVGHEAIVQEWYRDSVGVGTWAVGVTNASGHNVDRYKDNPQPLRKCLEVSIWLMRSKYLPDVLKAFDGHDLSEAQLAAALSFHYNTGAIGKADWVTAWKSGSVATARAAFMNYRKPPEIVPRREKERALFFDGTWSQDGRAAVYPVSKPSYSPKWSGAQRVDISADVAAILGGGA